MSRALFVPAVALALTLSACGSGDDGTQPAAAPTPAVMETATTPAVASPEASSSATAAPTPEARLLPRKELEKAVIGVADMPPGYSPDKDKDEDDSDDKTFCDYEQPHEAKDKVGQSFTKGGGLTATVASVGLRQFASVQAAEESFAALEAALETCDSEVYDGTKLEYSPVSVEQLGDRALGVRIEGDGYTLLQNFVLVGPVMVNAGTGGLMEVSAEETAEIVAKQVAAYEAVAEAR